VHCLSGYPGNPKHVCSVSMGNTFYRECTLYRYRKKAEEGEGKLKLCVNTVFMLISRLQGGDSVKVSTKHITVQKYEK
jgi:hypothetical protein